MHSGVIGGQSKQDAINLFTFLKEFARLSQKPIPSLDSYREVFWFGDVPQEEAECTSILWSQAEDAEGEDRPIPDGWLEIRRPERSEPPDPPEAVALWVDEEQWADSAVELPELHDSILNPDWESGAGDDEDDEEEVPQFLYLSDFPEVQSIWDDYVEKTWWEWAIEDRRKERVQQCYNDLFRLHRAKGQLGDQFELVLASGCLHWLDPDGRSVKRHLLTLPATVQFDSVNAAVSVGPDGSMAEAQLEVDMIAPQHHPVSDILQDVEQRKSALGNEIFAAEAQDLLKAWVQGLPSGKGRFLDSLDSVRSQPTDQPYVRFAPALILRKRSSRSLIEACTKIADNLGKEDVELPPLVGKMVGVIGPEGEGGNGGGSNGLPEFEDAEVYFPLPANDEQRQILGRLERETGVLMQGPPGTGKSQTIANLISDQLAKGKRILVTSQKAPALRVLQEKLPPSIASLCVLLLGEGHEEQSALRKSVFEITQRYTNQRSEETERKIARLKQNLSDLRAQLAKVFESLCLLREKETQNHSIDKGGYHGTLQGIASRICRERDTFRWFGDRLAPDISLVAEDIPACPVTVAEALATLELLRQISPEDEARCSRSRPSDEALAPLREFPRYAAVEKQGKERFQAQKGYLEHGSRQLLTKRSVEELTQLAKDLHEIASLSSSVLDRTSGWEVAAGIQILAGQTGLWLELSETSEGLLGAVREKLSEVADVEITGLDGRSNRVVLQHAKALHGHLCEGGKLGIGPFKPPVVKQTGYLTKQVTVDGMVCRDCDSLAKLIQCLEVQESIRKLAEQWQAYHQVDVVNMPLNQVASRYEQEHQKLKGLLELGDRSKTVGDRLASWDPLLVPAWNRPAEVTALENLAKVLVTEKKLEGIQNWFEARAKELERWLHDPNCSPEVRQLHEAIQNRVPHEVERGCDEVRRLNKIQTAIEERDRRMAVLSNRLPQLATALKESHHESFWPGLLQQVEAAWNWMCVDTWLAQISAPGVEQDLQTRLRTCREQISITVAELAAELAWTHCLRNMTGGHYQSLQAWSKAIEKLGKGTGKYAERHRQIARMRLEECRDAVPVWVMPLHKVLDTVRIAPGIFDIVIVDEASQCGPEAIFLSYLGTKLVVVGDDQQIRPDSVGIDQSQVHQLQDRYLKDIPKWDIFDVGQSLFGIGQVRFGNPVRLREHFRCMPEIIGFSNRLCYDDQPLIPLRQFGADRLTPVLSPVYVEGGFQEGRSVNKIEANCLIDAIEKCCEEPAYEGKTIGVVSLLSSSDQDRYINQQLPAHLDPEEIEQRNIICGDAYDFQGDERDIIFLSMVSARGEGRRIGTLSDQKAKRRFNVAVSRAKDQLWVFHSVTEEELGQNCLRRKLLSYVHEPKADPTGVQGIATLDELHQLARTVQRSTEKPPLPFDSWFEVDVYLAIADRQYHVIPQYEVSGYRIDLVIVGGTRKLAVECDGDWWHGPEQYQEDLRRQLELERCGWEFFRIRGSSFYLDPIGAMSGLWQILEGSEFSTSQDEVFEDGGFEEQEGVGPDTDDSEPPGMAEADEPEVEEPEDVDEPFMSLQKARPTPSPSKPKATPPPEPEKIDGEATLDEVLAMPNRILSRTIVTILHERPNNSCKKDDMTKFVCQHYGILTRGKRRDQLRRKVNFALSHLKKKRQIKEYKAKNIRVKLVLPAEPQLFA